MSRNSLITLICATKNFRTNSFDKIVTFTLYIYYYHNFNNHFHHNYNNAGHTCINGFHEIKKNKCDTS